MSINRAGLSRDETNRAVNLIKSLERHQDSYEFRLPVDYIGLGLPDYPEIIKCPMDLSTVKKNLKDGEYNSLQDFIMDIQLIWDNCKLYNPEESFISQQAGRLQEFMVGFCNANSIPLPTGKRKPKEPQISLQEKKELSLMVQEMDINTLSHISLIVEQECPEAFSQLERHKVVISLEKVGYSTFLKLKEIIVKEYEKKKNSEPPSTVTN